MAPHYQDPDEWDGEDLNRYCPGGFHPVHIGDVLEHKYGDMLEHKYTVLHKHGCGGFSTVWLAKDSADERLYALKILAADAPQSELDSIFYLATRLELTLMYWVSIATSPSWGPMGLTAVSCSQPWDQASNKYVGGSSLQRTSSEMLRGK